MKREARSVCIIVFLLAVAGTLASEASFLSVGTAAETSSIQTNAPAAAASKEACLSCHGPFGKLVANVNYQAPSGEKITPHRYVPHQAKEAKAVPECSNCHEPHPVPPTTSGLAALPKPEIQWCYTTCHHKNTFQSCKDCHK